MRVAHLAAGFDTCEFVSIRGRTSAALAKEVGLGSHKSGVTAPAARAQLRAELDGLIAHLYALTESEFTHILTTFPLVAQPVKDAALEAYRAAAKGELK